MTSRPSAAQHLRDLARLRRVRDLARLRRVRDRIDREYAQPLDVEALAHPPATVPGITDDERAGNLIRIQELRGAVRRSQP